MFHYLGQIWRAVGNNDCIPQPIKSSHFIALIHPTQSTIALPVGTTGPAKCQKKPSCVSTGRTGLVVCIRQVGASYFLPVLDSVTSWHLFRLAREVYRRGFEELSKIEKSLRIY